VQSRGRRAFVRVCALLVGLLVLVTSARPALAGPPPSGPGETEQPPLDPDAEAAKEQAAKEQAAKEQAAKEQAAKEQAAKEQAAKEQAAKEQAAKDAGDDEDADTDADNADDTDAQEQDEEHDDEAPPVYRSREVIPGQYPESTGMLVGQGIWAGTPDRRFTIRMSGFIHVDTRTATNLSERGRVIGGGDTLVYGRRARFGIDGRVFGQIDYRLMWDVLVDPVMPYDFHLDWRARPEFNIRVGGFKSPFGFERRARAYALPFLDRALPTSLAPNRDMGIYFYGQTKSGFFSYDVAVVTGAQNLGTRYEFSGTPDFAGRVYFQPFRLGDPSGPRYFPALHNFGVGASWTVGTEFGTEDQTRLSTIRVMPRGSVYGGRLLFRYLDDDVGSTLAHGLRDRQSVHGHWHHGRFRTLFEYTRSAQRVAKGFDDVGNPVHQAYLAHHAWQGIFSVNLSGDENTFFGVHAERPLNPSKGHWGSFTTSLRYQELYMDSATFPLFADPTRWAQTVRGLATSLQWHINDRFEAQFDLEWMIPGGGPGLNLPPEFSAASRLEMRY
jgi:phosphate-selective porin OprO and OprP